MKPLADIFLKATFEAALTPVRVYGTLCDGVARGIVKAHGVSPTFARLASGFGLGGAAIVYGLQVAAHTDTLIQNPRPIHYAATALLASGLVFPAFVRAAFYIWKGPGSVFERERAHHTFTPGKLDV